MGNNTSSVRKSSVSSRKIDHSDHQNLAEEFNDLVLHKQTSNQTTHSTSNIDNSANRPSSASAGNNTQKIRDRHYYNNTATSGNFTSSSLTTTTTPTTGAPREIQTNSSNLYSNHESKFNNDLIEDDLNELDDNLLETPTDLQPSIINTFNPSSLNQDVLIPVEIKWVNPTDDSSLDKVLIIGSFTNWRNFIQLNKVTSKEFKIIVNLPLGVHKLLYIINNEYRVSDSLPTATDQEGVFFNWFEVINNKLHSNNQPQNSPYLSNSIGNSIEAGVHELEQIKKKSNSFLINSTKQSTDFEHVEYLNDDNDDFHHSNKGKSDRLSSVDNTLSHKRYHQQHSNQNLETRNSHQLNEDEENEYNMQYAHEAADEEDEGVGQIYSNSALSIDKLSNSIEYLSEIPEMYTNYDFFLNNNTKEVKEPPQLPPHLNNVLLNKQNFSTAMLSHQNSSSSLNNPTSNTHFTNRPPLRRANHSQYYDSNSLSIPNHVILNHLITTSIKNDILIVGCINRYSGKFVTQIMYSPVNKHGRSDEENSS